MIGGGLLSGLAGAGVNAVFDAAGSWVASGAVWLLDQIGAAMEATTAVPLGTSWFASHEVVMAATAAVVVLPMLAVSAIQAVIHQSPSALLRAFLVQLPAAMVLTGVAVTLVRLGLSVTDTLSSQMLQGAGGNADAALKPLADFLGQATASPAAPAFVLFLAGVTSAVCALGLWLELVVRAAAVSVAVLFLPLALAALVWPAVSHWCRRLADTLAALILSKLVIAAVLSLAAAAIAGGLGADGPGGGGFGAVLAGVAMLVIATVAPFTLLRLVPAVEAGAVAHLEAARHRLTATATVPYRAANLAASTAATGGAATGTALLATAGRVEAGGDGTAYPLLDGIPGRARWMELMDEADGAAVGAAHVPAVGDRPGPAPDDGRDRAGPGAGGTGVDLPYFDEPDDGRG